MNPEIKENFEDLKLILYKLLSNTWTDSMKYVKEW